MRVKELNTKCGLLPPEQAVMDDIVGAWNKFIKLEKQHPEDTNEFAYAIHRLEIQNIGILEWALKKTEHIESDLAFLKHTKGVPIYEETIRDATLMRRVLELAARGKERGCYLGPGDPRIRAKEGRDEAGLYHTSIQG